MNYKLYLKDVLQAVLLRFGYYLTKTPRKVIRETPEANLKMSLEYVVYHHLHYLPDDSFTVVQVGAYDGISLNDEVHPLLDDPRFRAVLVEPQPKVFAALKENYAEYENVAFENCAIDAVEQRRPLYVVDANAPDCPSWLYACASFDRSLFMQYAKIYPKIDEYIQHVEVPCMRLDHLVRKHRLNRIDLLQIDVEGYDFEIIKTIDFENMAPRIIRYERRHLSKEDAEASYNTLINAGYQIAIDGIDAIAYRPLTHH